ncbi:MAG TPA: hypothetical protein VE987_16075 [Polyangiaceae bacterium]|nr:hypothetical protein [Polyangiaceae bacterium]
MPLPDPTRTTTESVERPEPGLARGRWEAPPWVFFAMIALMLLAVVAYGAAAIRGRRSAARRPR